MFLRELIICVNKGISIENTKLFPQTNSTRGIDMRGRARFEFQHDEL